MSRNAKLIRNLVLSCRNELEELAESPPAQGHAAQDEIEEAIIHLEAALVDLNEAVEEE